MNIQAEKIELIQILLQTNSEDIIKKVKTLLKKEQKDWWDETSEAERRSIEKGLAQLDRGEGIPHEKVMKKYR